MLYGALVSIGYAHAPADHAPYSFLDDGVTPLPLNISVAGICVAAALIIFVLAYGFQK